MSDTITSWVPVLVKAIAIWLIYLIPMVWVLSLRPRGALLTAIVPAVIAITATWLGQTRLSSFERLGLREKLLLSIFLVLTAAVSGVIAYLIVNAFRLLRPRRTSSPKPEDVHHPPS